jgi:hypothetical protein
VSCPLDEEEEYTTPTVVKAAPSNWDDEDVDDIKARGSSINSSR